MFDVEQYRQELFDSARERALEKRVKRRRKKALAWVLAAIDYWEERICEMDIGCDWSDADIRCWRCGHLRGCQKCHIVPRSLGGGDGVENLIPLCAQCHDEMPNVADDAEVWRWIKRDHGQLHDTYWTVRAMKESGLSEAELASIDIDALRKNLERISLHFGQLYGSARQSVSSLAWAIRESAKKENQCTA